MRQTRSPHPERLLDSPLGKVTVRSGFTTAPKILTVLTANTKPEDLSVEDFKALVRATAEPETTAEATQVNPETSPHLWRVALDREPLGADFDAQVRGVEDFYDRLGSAALALIENDTIANAEVA